MIELVQAELLVELGNAAAGIDQLLLTSEEGVTLRAHALCQIAREIFKSFLIYAS